MVTLPEEFVATRYPGYFWNTKINKLFTAKLGVLRELKLSYPNAFNRLDQPAYRISHRGKRHNLYLAYLRQLRPNANSVFPVVFKTFKSNTNDDVAVSMSKLPAGTPVTVFVGDYDGSAT